MASGHGLKPRTVALRLSVVALVVVMMSGWNRASTSAPATNGPGVTKTTITFGQTAPQSGPAALYGESTNGVRAYFSYINSKGGVLHGHKLKLISYDDMYSPAVSVELTRKLVDQDHVFAEVAVNGSATNKANLTIQTPANVPLIGSQTGASFLQPFVKNVYNVWPAYTIEGKLLANYGSKKLHLKRIGVLYQNDDFGKSLLQGVHDANITTATEQSYEPTQTDFSPQVQALKSKNADGVIILAIPGATTAFLKAMAAVNYKPVRLMSQVAAIPEQFSLSPQMFPGSYLGAFVPPPTDKKNKQVKTFLAAMNKYEPAKPTSVFAEWGWMEAQVAVAGLKLITGSITPNSYENALNRLKKFHFMGGTISYSSLSHLGLKHMFMEKAAAGKLVQITR